MRQMLRSTLRRSLEAMPAVDRLRAAWPVACGAVLAAHAEITGYEAATVTVRGANPAWMEQMRSMRGVLEHELARIAGVPVRAIHFEQAEGDTPRRPQTARRNGEKPR